jgi:hypothetical protein
MATKPLEDEFYTAKLGPVGSEYITPAREVMIISYEDKKIKK